MSDVNPNAGEVTEVPPAAENIGDGAEQTPVTVPEPAPVVEEQPKSTVVDYSSRFQAAREKALSDTAEPDAGEDPESGKDEEPKSDEADDKIPADKDDALKDDPSEPETPKGDEADKDGDADKKTSRSQSFKDMEAEVTATRSRVEALEQQFEQHGGLDVVETAMQMFEKFANGNAVEVISELPAHQRKAIADSVLGQVMNDPNVRVESVNAILTNEFGLKSALPQPLIEKVFEYVVGRANSDVSDLEAYLDYKIEALSTPESELERTKRELDNLKNGDSGQEKAAESTAAPVDDPMIAVNNANRLYDEFERTSYATVAEPLLAQYGFDVKANDTPAVKTAKETLAGALESYIAEEMRTAQAFKPLLPYWLEFGGDEAALQKLNENQLYASGVKSYQRAMRAKGESVIKSLATLLGSAQAAAPSQPPPAEPRTPTVPNSAGTRQVVPDEQKKVNRDEPKGFGSAFATAKKTALG